MPDEHWNGKKIGTVFLQNGFDLIMNVDLHTSAILRGTNTAVPQHLFDPTGEKSRPPPEKHSDFREIGHGNSLLSIPKLHIVEFAIFAVLFQKLFVGAGFDNPAVIHHMNDIGMFDGG